MKLLKIVQNGIIDDNPTFRMVLGMCPTIAVTNSVNNAFGMGIAAAFVIVATNFVVSLLRNYIPSKVRIPAFVVIIAAFVTVVQLLIEGFFPALHESLGIFIPLITVNCIILGRVEAFAYKNPPMASLFDGIGVGIGFTGALVLVATVREILGDGTFMGHTLFTTGFDPAKIMTMPPGGFFALAGVMVVFNVVLQKVRERKQ